MGIPNARIVRAPTRRWERAEVTRTLVRAVDQGGLDDNDRAYLAQVVAARTGLPPDEAQRRVAEVESSSASTRFKLELRRIP